MTGLTWRCPWCGHLADGVMGVSEPGDRDRRPPRPGDVSLCIRCAQPAIWTSYGVRLPTPDESAGLMSSPLVAKAAAAIRRVNGGDAAV